MKFPMLVLALAISSSSWWSTCCATKTFDDYIKLGSVTDIVNNLYKNDNIQHAAEAFKKLSTNPKLQDNTGIVNKQDDDAVYEIGSGPDGGRLLRFRSVAEGGNDSSTSATTTKTTNKMTPFSSETRRTANGPKSSKGTKASKGTKSPKGTKMPKGTKSPKAHMCTELVAEDQNWQTWNMDITTFTPIFRPATDVELRGIITSSKIHGCTIRMMGARGSWDGMIMQRNEKNIVVVSLASHATKVDGWQNEIDPKSSTFRIGAGKSWYDVSAMIRPHGYVLNSRTAFAFFSVGGVIANMVHGGGRTTGFMHDDVVRMLVLTSDGNFRELIGDELRYWRSSAGQLGVIVAIEMSMHSEEIPFVSGINPATGELILDEERGGLVMDKERTIFDAPTDSAEFIQLIKNFTTKVYTTSASYENAQFFFDYYSTSLAEYRTNYSGPRFSGGEGSSADVEKAAQYETATNGMADANTDVAFTGMDPGIISVESICAIFCLPPTGPPPAGDGTPCIPIPSSTHPGKRLCEVPLETSAALSISSHGLLDGLWDISSSTANDGYFAPFNTLLFDLAVIFVPARALSSAFGVWYSIFTSAVTNSLPDTEYFPNTNLEFRFIDPTDTAVLNPIPTIDEVKADFNEKYAPFYGDSAFDLLIPPINGQGVPDGFVALEVNSLRNIYDNDVSKFMFAIQEAWNSMPTNPLLPYDKNIVKECILNEILPCSGPPVKGTKCCNPPIPVFSTHLGKSWGWAVDPLTTPTTGKLQPFKDADTISNVFTVGSKQKSINDFNTKRDDLNASVFSGGAMLRWLDPSTPNTHYEVRHLEGQECGSSSFKLNPDRECISNSCINSICK